MAKVLIMRLKADEEDLLDGELKPEEGSEHVLENASEEEVILQFNHVEVLHGLCLKYPS